MKAVIIHDSRYGNTKEIAFAIRDGLLGAAGAVLEVEAIHASAAEANQFAQRGPAQPGDFARTLRSTFHVTNTPGCYEA